MSTPKNSTTDNNSPGYGYVVPKLDEHGRVIVSPISLVATADRKPPSMGDRVRKYQRSPQFQQDQLLTDMFDADEHDPDSLADPHSMPISPYEERHQALLERVSERKKAERDQQKAAEIAAEKAAKEAFRQRFQELQAEGAIPVRQTPPDGAQPAPNGSGA